MRAVESFVVEPFAASTDWSFGELWVGSPH